MNKYNIKFFPFITILVLTLLNFIDIASAKFMVNGEIVYTCGFLLVFYIIWGEAHELYNTALKPLFSYSDVACFWVNFLKLERSILLLVAFKIRLINSIVILFSLTSIVLKLLNLLQTDVYRFKIVTQLLNKVKLKTKSLPLQ